MPSGRKQASEQRVCRWQDTVIVTYREFGRRAKGKPGNGNRSRHRQHPVRHRWRRQGAAFTAVTPLTQLSGDGNLLFTTDYRSLTAPVDAVVASTRRKARRCLPAKHAPLPLFARAQ